MPRIYLILQLTLFSLIATQLSYAQVDTGRNYGIDSFILKKKGLFGKLAKNNITGDNNDDNAPVRNDLLFLRYQGRPIRRIEIYEPDFGTPITDTTRRLQNTLTYLANHTHRQTRHFVIENNLFFKHGDAFSAALLADNERHLRDQPYLQDARITVRPVAHSDSVDIAVFTKDVLSIGGSFNLHNSESLDLSLKEDNLGGWGDRLQGSMLFDVTRLERFSSGIEYIKRNIAGSFIDATVGFKNYSGTFNTGKPEEKKLYTSFVRPLVNPYVKFTYSLNVDYHETSNMYHTDSLYKQALQYRYFNFDTWVAWNSGAFKLFSGNYDDRLRTIFSTRYFRQDFNEIPMKYDTIYSYQYSGITGILGAVDLFKQSTYRTRNVYGFGRNEDVPEGIDIAVTGGWTDRQQRERPYFGINFQRYYFTKRESYFNYTLRTGGYFYRGKLEDGCILMNLDYFSRLISLGNAWKQRSFVTFGITKQFNPLLSEPLFLESGSFGLPEWRTGNLVIGDTRITLKAESVFFSPLNIINFHFAPFVFGNATVLKPFSPITSPRNWYNNIGAGIRTRNESLIFGTIELKGYYFPRGNYTGEQWRVELNTGIRFKYNQQLIKRPELVQVN